jgi:hypothetical protein
VISIAQELINKLSSNVKVELNEFSWSDHNEGHPVNTKKVLEYFQDSFIEWSPKTLLVDHKKLSEKNLSFMLNLETSSGEFLKGKSDLYVLRDSLDSLHNIIVLMEIKKPDNINSSHLDQAVVQLIAAHTTSIFTPLHILTDLKTSWILQWITFNDNNDAILNKLELKHSNDNERKIALGIMDCWIKQSLKSLDFLTNEELNNYNTSLTAFNDFSSRFNSSIDNKIDLEKKFNNINDDIANLDDLVDFMDDTEKEKWKLRKMLTSYLSQPHLRQHLEGVSPFNFASEYVEDYYNLFSSHGNENHHKGEHMSIYN